jgi:cyclopropane-fatty-acyl-phospholipid synthase
MFEKKVKKIFSRADIKINGSRPWDIKVNDKRFYSALAFRGMTGMGDAYVRGWWDCDQLDVMFTKALKARINRYAKFNLVNFGHIINAKLFNLQKPSRAFIVGKEHYDIGNDLYELMLDKRMVYTCGYWKDAKNLDEAQEAKLHLVCKKIGLKKGQRVLDIGCGWGSFAQFAAEKYGARVVGITVSKEQAELARRRCKGLPVEIRLQDYRKVNEKFDHIISLGMFEHVGHKNYRAYMEVAHRCLNDDGFFLLHTMGEKDSYPNFNQPECHWIIKNIFPNGMLPSVAQIGKSTEGLFVMEDWHTFGSDYDKTMTAWFNNFDKSWPKLKGKYSEAFRRKWKYYLMLFIGGWRSRNQYNLWQIVLSKNGVPGGYRSIR